MSLAFVPVGVPVPVLSRLVFVSAVVGSGTKCKYQHQRHVASWEVGKMGGEKITAPWVCEPLVRCKRESNITRLVGKLSIVWMCKLWWNCLLMKLSVCLGSSCKSKTWGNVDQVFTLCMLLMMGIMNYWWNSYINTRNINDNNTEHHKTTTVA